VAALRRISIVVPSFNQGAFLRAALESIFSQGYPNVEIVVGCGLVRVFPKNVSRPHSSNPEFS
jgi:GT2 family glycosyltransferase